MEVYAALNEDSTYSTIELVPELLEIIESKHEPLYFKAPANEGFAVLCSESQTFKLKRKNHSNNVILAYHEVDQLCVDSKDDSAQFADQLSFKRLVGITSFDSDFECRLDKGTIETAMLPVYHGELDFSPKEYHLSTSIEQLRNNSPISNLEFDNTYTALKGSEVNGYACILSDRFLSEALDRVIVTIQATTNDFSSVSASELTKHASDPRFPIQVITTVLRKFSTSTTSSTFAVDEKKVAVWYGIETLKQHAKKLIAPNEFLIKWKASFPQLYNIPVEMHWLAGYFARPLNNRIQYFPKLFLSPDPAQRFKELFTVQSKWDLDEITPFVEELNVKGLKMDKFIIKYARRRTEGKRVVVMGR